MHLVSHTCISASRKMIMVRMEISIIGWPQHWMVAGVPPILKCLERVVGASRPPVRPTMSQRIAGVRTIRHATSIQRLRMMEAASTLQTGSAIVMETYWTNAGCAMEMASPRTPATAMETSWMNVGFAQETVLRVAAPTR